VTTVELDNLVCSSMTFTPLVPQKSPLEEPHRGANRKS
jgi:hypothetical protein